MELRELLIQGFEFDRWANQAWFTALAAKGWPEPDRGIYQHILAAQEIWYLRTQGTSPQAMPTPELSEATIDRLHHAWVELLRNASDDPIIEYHRLTGEHLRHRLTYIARHVVDHGTYHRGELRGLCRSRGDDDFPESGLMLYFLTEAPAE